MDVIRSTSLRGLRAALVTATVVLAACGAGPRDESANWSPEKLYSEAKDEASAGAYDKAAQKARSSRPAK